MSNEACNLALKNTINEIRNVCPGISHTFIFRDNGEILAVDDNTSEDAVNNAQELIRALEERASAVGGIESLTFRGSKARIDNLKFDDLFVTSISSNESEEKTVSNLIKVMIPTTLKVMQRIYPSMKDKPQEAALNLKPTDLEPETKASDIQASEFTVENLTVFGGFLNDPETAYIDVALIVEWTEKYGDKPIEAIILEAPSTGKTIQCKFRPFREKKYENKGLIQLSEKIQTNLNIRKGSKVLVKPLLENPQDLDATPKDKHETIKLSKYSLIREKNVEDNTSEKLETPKESVELLKADLFKEFEEYKQEVPILQVLVENLGGFVGRLGNHDFVRIDNIVIARWKEIFGEKEIKAVIVKETISGKEIQCKFQAIKDSEFDGKSVIQIPEKLQEVLGTTKGALVLIKPVVE